MASGGCERTSESAVTNHCPIWRRKLCLLEKESKLLAMQFSVSASPLVARRMVQNPHNIKYNGTIQGLKYIWRTEGFRGLFKGNGTNCARIVPNSAVKFFSYEQASKGILSLYQQQTGNEDAQLTPLLRLGAGACAGIIAMSATFPMDMVRGRLTVQTDKSPYQYRGMFHALSTVLRQEGPRALYKGWLPSVIGVVPYVGLNFAVLACGAAAGTIGQTVAYPLDVIRRRMQMVGWKDAASIVTESHYGRRKNGEIPHILVLEDIYVSYQGTTLFVRTIDDLISLIKSACDQVIEIWSLGLSCDHFIMDQVAEELVANDVHGNADLQAKGYDPSTLEPRNALGSPIMCASMRSDWAESSTTDYMDTSRMEEKGLK
ncbi:hypothetical protein NC652_032972 [Populus alba x Populus x berolinensis]|nr:hypothetical protein NC652_032972 [Populus alba x Populus x berolinensis]